VARIRTIKPEFWTDEELTECSRDARLLFIGTWNFADDNGNLDRSAKQLKARVFPIDNIDCEPLIQELMTHRKLIEYSVSGKKYLHIRGFAKHQVINRPSSPQCPAYEESLATQAQLPDDSVSQSGVLTEDSRGKEVRKEGNTTAVARPLNGKDVLSEIFLTAWSEYPKRAGDNPRKRAWKAWRTRHAQGHTEDELLAGVRRYADFVRATGKEGTEYVKQAATFFGPDKAFLEAWTLPTSASAVSRDAREQVAL
jgi:hypothetical protein